MAPLQNFKKTHIDQNKGARCHVSAQAFILAELAQYQYSTGRLYGGDD